METTEKVVEAYVRYVKNWATIPNIRCAGQYEIDLIAINPKTLERYHIETSVSGSQAYSKLTTKAFDPLLLKERVSKAKMRRTLGYFVEQKFGKKAVIDELEKYGFTADNHKKVIVTWDSTPDARDVAKQNGIVVWHFKDMMLEIGREIRTKRTYFGDDTFRTLNLFVRAQPK